jgi:hypothetical protein
MTSLEALAADLTRLADEHLRHADAELAHRYPGDPQQPQPVHTVYVPADRFTENTPREWGRQALDLLDRFAPDAPTAAAATGLDPALLEEVHPRVVAKLETQPVEDLRVDFEDGYGIRPDPEEDAAVQDALAGLTAYRGTYRGTARAGEPADAPSWSGIRFKSLEAPTRARGLRTLAAVVAGLADGGLPDGLRLTLPKVTSVDQVEAMTLVCRELEDRFDLRTGSLAFEIQVETAQAILAADGTAAVAAMVHAAQGRCTGLHYGTFDYSAGLGIVAAHQSLDHPAADHAKAVMQVAAAQTGVTLSDGSTNVVGFGDADAAHATWRLHTGLVTRSLARGYYQGWDMHPGHLPSRYLATFAFFRSALPAACARLRAYLDRTAGGVMDEPATARALATAVLRGVRCGAVDQAEVERACGLGAADLLGLAGGRRG